MLGHLGQIALQIVSLPDFFSCFPFAYLSLMLESKQVLDQSLRALRILTEFRCHEFRDIGHPISNGRRKG